MPPPLATTDVSVYSAAGHPRCAAADDLLPQNHTPDACGVHHLAIEPCGYR